MDCLIIGGGPAGLTAAIYAARFHLGVKVIDAGASRAASIPCTRNHAGFPGGVSGAELVRRMREQAQSFGVMIERGRVEALEVTDDGFRARWAGGEVEVRAVILATGCTNRRPTMEDALHDAAVQAGRLRYCPVCDGFEVTDQRVGVIGTGAHGAREAMFVRSFTRIVALIAPGPAHDLDADQLNRLAGAEVELVAGPVADFALAEEGLGFRAGSERLSFEAVYPALGSVVHSDLAVAVGAETTAEGCLKVDAHQRTTVPGLYAAGDVVRGLDQISHAMGEAGVAATTLRNDLADRSPLLR